MAKIAEVQEVAVGQLVPYDKNAKLHDQAQVEKIANSIKEFGFISPCLIDHDYNIIAGHGRVAAAKKIGLETVPCVFIEGLTDEQRRAYILADNRLTELGGWDMDLVQEELNSLREVGFDTEVIGFDLEEIPDVKDFIKDKPEENDIPQSELCLMTVTTFSRNADEILVLSIDQETAARIIERINSDGPGVVTEALRGALNEI